MMLTSNTVHILEKEISEKGRREDGVQYVPTIYVKEMTWNGTSGVICKYSFTVSDGVNDIEMVFSTIPEFRKRLYPLVR